MMYAEAAERKLYTESCQRELTLAFDNGKTLRNDAIYSESMELEQTLCDESELTFGKCAAACFKVRVLNTAQGYKGLKLIPTITSGSYPRKLGTFWVDSDNLTSDKLYRDIVAYDALYKVMGTDVSEWYKNLNLPMAMRAFRNSFFLILGSYSGMRNFQTTLRVIKRRIYEMEHTTERIDKNYDTKSTSLVEVASYTKEMDKRMDKQGSAPWKVCEAFKMVSEQFGIRLPDDFVKVPEYEQQRLPINGAFND